MWTTEMKRLFRWSCRIGILALLVLVVFLVNQEIQAYQSYDEQLSQKYADSYKIAEQRANIYHQWIINQEKINRKTGSDYQDASDHLNFKFWQQMVEIDRNLSYAWKQHEYHLVDKTLTKREVWIKKHFKTFVYPEKNEQLMEGSKKDFLLKLKIHKTYRQHHNLNYLFEGKPTVTKLLIDLFRTGFLCIALLVYLLLLAGDGWAREFETGGYRLLFTSSLKRSTIYWVRNGVLLLASLLACLLVMGIIIFMSYSTYGLGLDIYYLMGGQLKEASDVLIRGAGYFVCLVLAWLALINLASWVFKDRGMVYLLGVLSLAFLLFSGQLLDWMSWSSLGYGILLMCLLGLVCLSHYWVFKQMNRRDLRE